MAGEQKTRDQLLADIESLESKVRELQTWKAAKKKEENLHKERHFRLGILADSTTDAIYQLRYDSMTYDYLSPGIKALTGYDAEEINQVGFANLVIEMHHPDGTEIAREYIMEQRQRGATREFHADYLIRTKDGATRWLGDHSFPWLDDSGTALGSVGILTDITARKELEDKLRRRATTDFLTGASTRRHFMNLATREIMRSRRTGSPLSLIIFDVDHFKKINDAHGHAAGDRVLRNISEICRSQLRVSDSLGRLGGEEFAILLVDCELAMALEVAERLRALLEDTVLELCSGTVRCTVSFGVAELTGDAEGLEKLMERADAALYSAKRQGRNQVRAGFNP